MPMTLAPLQCVDAPLLQLIAEADAYMLALYPAISNHLTDPATLLDEEGLFMGVYVDEKLVGCGAVRLRQDQSRYGEIKRLFVTERWRGHGFSKSIMSALEQYLVAQGVNAARLETGIWQPEALGLYMKLGYVSRGTFGGYVEDPLSVFLEKKLL
jgi:putative acetyltransferase